ncbi:DUF2804 domain-containing protein [Pendulispora brunnea]|uniref:DUF2804 domain-containing protein n=1 Tax=Pendulispora brunnea TaxID=2905690 RepID=A0ABZ2KMR8_9BACT
MSSVSLPEVPDGVLDASGAVRFGTYRGELRQVTLPRGSFFRHKRWIYTFVATKEIIALHAIVDLGYAANAFVLVADRAARSVLYDKGFTGLPRPFVHVGPRAGDARFRLPGVDLRAGFSSADGSYRQHVRASGLLWLGELATTQGPPALTVIAPIAKGGTNVTQKSAALAASGMLEVAGRSFDLRGGVGGFDYTNGLLARHTAWRWAFACGTLGDVRIGFNLVEGFNEANGVSENALFFGEELVPLGRARFSWNRNDVLATWRCTTEPANGAALDLTFEPIGAHREDRNLGIVRSHFAQPVGHFSGTITLHGRSYPVEHLPGVTEDQDVVW